MFRSSLLNTWPRISLAGFGLPHIQTNSDITIALFHNHRRIDPTGGAIDSLNDIQLFQLLQLFRYCLTPAEWNAAEGLCHRCNPIILVQFYLVTS